MSSTTPSRQALRMLARICHSIENAGTSIGHYESCHGSHTRPLVCRSYALSKASRRDPVPHRSHDVCPSIRSRHFTSLTTRHIQPRPNLDTDPQNTATPTLPDITNYYTLFPKTLPNGVPGPGPRIQEPDPPALTGTQPSSSGRDRASSSAGFTIHLPTLRREFIQLQSQHHPDKYPTGTTSHTKALALSALINNAYKTLSDPLLRAQYLLNLLYEIDVTSEDNTAHPTDQQTLMEVMEAQEQVEDAKTQEEVDVIKTNNARRTAETERKMGELFETGDVQGAKEETVRLKYWRSLQSALDEWEEGKEVRLIH